MSRWSGETWKIAFPASEFLSTNDWFIVGIGSRFAWHLYDTRFTQIFIWHSICHGKDNLTLVCLAIFSQPLVRQRLSTLLVQRLSSTRSRSSADRVKFPDVDAPWRNNEAETVIGSGADVEITSGLERRRQGVLSTSWKTGTMRGRLLTCTTMK